MFTILCHAAIAATCLGLAAQAGRMPSPRGRSGLHHRARWIARFFQVGLGGVALIALIAAWGELRL